MKKVIVLILIFLPIFLMISISFAGRIFSVISFIEVESVSIVTEDEKEITDTFKIGLNAPVLIKAKILPELATNKKVTYKIIPASRLEFNNQGELVGLEYGFATIMVETENMRKTNQITVQVTDEVVSSVSLNANKLELNVKGRYSLIANVYPVSALNKKVTWHSSNPSIVEVTQGNLYAKAPTPPDEPVIITVTTEDGEHTDTCAVTVNAESDLAFIEPEGSTVYIMHSETLNLMNVIEYSNNVNVNDIVFVITSGGVYASIFDNVLTIHEKSKIIEIRAYVVGKEDFYCEMNFVWQ